MKSQLNFRVNKEGVIYDMHELGIWVSSFHIHSPNVSRSKIVVPGMPGAHLSSTQEGERQVVISLQIETDDMNEFDELKHSIFDLFYSKDEITIVRDLTPNREIKVLQEGSYDINNLSTEDGEFELHLTMVDPYVYDSEQTIPLYSESGTTINVEGTAKTKPIFEFDVLAPITFAMVSNGEEYMVIGQPTTVDEQVVNAKTLLFEEYGSTINEWLTATPEMEGGSQGTIGYDGAGITAPSYGSGNYFHGPSVYKEVPVTGDFEIELRGQLLTDNVQQTGRIGFFLFDDQMREIAFMAAADNSVYVPRKLAEGRIGPFIKDFQNYIVSSRNYQWEWDNFPALLRLRRVGDRYEFLVARVLGDGRHMDPLTASWTVFEDKFRGSLKYVGIFIDKHGDTPSPHTARIDYIKAYQLNQITVEQTPYIADVGDKIVFNHKTRELLLNGESVKKGELGASPFKLTPGENTLVLLPENSLQGVVKYGPAYK